MATDNNQQHLFTAFADKLQAAGSNEWNIESFRRNYSLLLDGVTGKIPGSTIHTVTDVPRLDDLPAAETSGNLIAKTAVIKLNGGLGTSMGLERAKSVIVVKDSLHFLDIIARQVLYMKQQKGIHIPLLFMNSYNTHEDTESALRKYDSLQTGIPLGFLQNKVPKVDAETFAPAEHAPNRELEWCPPGHGDIYTALQSSGILRLLLEQGYEYVFISNADNLGAVLDERVLNFLEQQQIPFLMEVAQRTDADRKGGHLAMTHDGRLTLRERAQCPDEEQDEFQDIERYSYFNTNSLWLRLSSLQDLLKKHYNVLPLPLIRNEKTIDPRNPASSKVFQLETAMGAAISLFEGSKALLVPRSRFAPVKSTDDLLAVRSDAYMLTDEYQVVLHPDRSGTTPDIHLDPLHYRHVDQLDAAFPAGPPSLLECTLLRITGKYRFGKNVRISGSITLENAGKATITIPDNTLLRNH